jgi:hypothetical protein
VLVPGLLTWDYLLGVSLNFNYGYEIWINLSQGLVDLFFSLIQIIDCKQIV